MPWLETSSMMERHRFIDDLYGGLFSMTELCARYGVSRKTGYKWLDRYNEQGRAGLRTGATPSSSVRPGSRTRSPAPSGWRDRRIRRGDPGSCSTGSGGTSQCCPCPPPAPRATC